MVKYQIIANKNGVLISSKYKLNITRPDTITRIGVFIDNCLERKKV